MCVKMKRWFRYIQTFTFWAAAPTGNEVLKNGEKFRLYVRTSVCPPSGCPSDPAGWTSDSEGQLKGSEGILEKSEG